jgi:drug/metabolite transporter (DMT)-like permease
MFYLPFVLPDVFLKIPKISLNVWFAVLYLAIICSVFGYIGWYHALSKIPASKAAVFLNLIPLFTIIISFFIGELPNLLFIIGSTFIMTGIYITQKSD